jgi:hypothetical protein
MVRLLALLTHTFRTGAVTIREKPRTRPLMTGEVRADARVPLSRVWFRVTVHTPLS